MGDKGRKEPPSGQVLWELEGNLGQCGERVGQQVKEEESGSSA